MCALPSAQLGSMPSLNVPSYIPTTVVQKEPKAWEKALLAILTQAGGAVANRGVENAMSQEYAPEFGKTPTTGFSKFLFGPTTGERQALQLRGEDSAMARLQSEIDSARSLQENKLAADTLHDTSQYAQQGLHDIDQDIAARGLERLRMENDMNKETARGGNEQALARLKAELEAKDPLKVAMAGEYGALSEQRLADAALKRRQEGIAATYAPGAPGATGKPSTVNPNVAKFATSGGAQPQPTSPPVPSLIDQVRQGMAQGKSPEQVIQEIEDQARQTSQYREAQTMVKTKEQATLEELKRRLGITPQPGSYGSIPLGF